MAANSTLPANATMAANSTLPAGGANETVADVDQNIDWTALEQLVTGYGQCNSNITSL